MREFKCHACGHEFEELQRTKVVEKKIEEDEEIKCPECDARAKPVEISLSAHGKNSSWPV